MEESNISNDKKDIQIIKKIFLHIVKPEYLPVGLVYESIQNINNLVNDSYDEICIGDLLDYIDYNEAMALLNLIRDKIKINGFITIQASDIYALSSSIAFNDIDVQTAKLVLYNQKKTIYTIYEIETELKNRNFNILEKKYINIFEYYIRATKNG